MSSDVPGHVTPSERPLSVVVLGNSVAFMQQPARKRRDEGTYGEVLVERLYAAGVPACLHLESRWFELVHDALRRYETAVRVHAPDVLVIQYGLNESQPWLVPMWLLRHLMTRFRTATPITRWYREHVAARLWRLLRRFRRVASRLAGTRTWQMTPRRFAGKLRQLIRAARYEQRSLVLVLDVNRPGELLEHWLPGMQERHAIYQRAIRRVVDGFADPDVRLVEVSAVEDALGADALPDGMHYSTAAHRWVGERLATEVLGWQREPT